MKKTIKIIGILFLILMGLGGLTRAIVKPVVENSFEGQIRRANRDCPIPVANGVGQVSSISLEERFIVYRLDYKPEYLNTDVYRNNPEATRDMFYLAFLCMNGQGGHVDMMSDELLKRGYGLRIIASNGVSSFTSELSPAYIKEMQNRINVNPTEALHDALRLKFETENCTSPVKIDEGIRLTGLNINDTNIIVEVEIDENLYDISSFVTVSDEFANNIIAEANNGDPELGALLDLCKISHTGLTYRMTGNRSKSYCDMNIPCNLIRQNRIVPQQVNIH
ncbi:hypothetical protein [uncultured Muribaculum sp.]|uniref:hypothetical protein n=1 Tax=uncultured Muribaculum sp. TaxID=1918613 RepID=UPI00272FE962|nr:hypothetical protein [uncultured Muribaculum sp.]